jgi:hypothetical protein
LIIKLDGSTNAMSSMRGEADQTKFTVNAGNGEPADAKEAIFPIFRTDQAGMLHLLGTGFFITRLGIFVSAKHVFEDVIDANDRVNDGLTIIQFDKYNKYYLRPVTAFVLHGLADVAVGVCAPMSHKVTREPLYNKVLTLSSKHPRIFDVIYTYAYPGTKVIYGDKQEVQVSPKFYAGTVTDYFPTGRDRVLLPHPCYQTSIVLHGAASGGPVFGPGGTVIGVNSTGYEGNLDISFISRIEDIMDLKLRDVIMPDESEPRNVPISELVSINHVSIK